MTKQEKNGHIYIYILSEHKNYINFTPGLVQIIQTEVNELTTMLTIKIMLIHINYIQIVTLHHAV